MFFKYLIFSLYLSFYRSRTQEVPLAPPCNYHKPNFSWSQYLQETSSQAVPASAFRPRPPLDWKVGMCLEVVDHLNPQLIRAASVVDVKYYHIKIHWEGWLSIYDTWIEDDSPELHPVGYCEATGHELQPPLGYMHDGKRTLRCWPKCKKQSLGNEQLFKFFTHNKPDYCPYKERSESKKSIKIDFYKAFYNQYFYNKLTITQPTPSTSKSTPICDEKLSSNESVGMYLPSSNELENYYDFQLAEVRSTTNLPSYSLEIGDINEEQARFDVAHSILQWDIQQTKDYVHEFTKSQEIADTFSREVSDL